MAKSNNNKTNSSLGVRLADFSGALLVKFIVYIAVACVFILLFWWSGIIENFSWKYVLVLALGLLFLRIFIAEIFIKSER